MRVHRTEHPRNYTLLPNCVAQNRRLSYTARGVHADLISRPDGWREDARTLADSSPQGRGAVRRALKELEAAGLYRVEKIRLSDGTLRTVTHVYDIPQQVAPTVDRRGPGWPTDGSPDAYSNNREKEPTLPAESAESADPDPVGGAEPEAQAGETGRPGPAVPDEQTREAVATLFRAIRPEPRLRIGAAEALALAPLVAQWLERGCTAADLTRALLPGLPVDMRSAVGVLRYRLRHKLPPLPLPLPLPLPDPERPAVAGSEARQGSECAECRVPLPRPGICGACAGLEAPPLTVGGGAAATARGVALARAAMSAARASLGIGRPAPAW